MKVRFRGVVVTIYRKSVKYPFYRIACRGDGGRVVRNFTTLAAAKKAAEAKEWFNGLPDGAAKIVRPHPAAAARESVA